MDDDDGVRKSNAKGTYCNCKHHDGLVNVTKPSYIDLRLFLCLSPRAAAPPAVLNGPYYLHLPMATGQWPPCMHGWGCWLSFVIVTRGRKNKRDGMVRMMTPALDSKSVTNTE